MFILYDPQTTVHTVLSHTVILYHRPVLQYGIVLCTVRSLLVPYKSLLDATCRESRESVVMGDYCTVDYSTTIEYLLQHVQSASINYSTLNKDSIVSYSELKGTVD